MNIKDECTVEVTYTITGDDGEVLESSEESGPLAYVHGEGELPPALEQLFSGCAEGDEVEQLFEPGQCFPDFDPEMIISIPSSEFPADTELTAGESILITVEDDSGESGELEARVVETNPEAVVVDANHPLAGQSVHFIGRVIRVEAPG